MAHNSLSARRIAADDLFTNPAQRNLPIEPGALSLHHPPETLSQVYGSDDVNAFSLRVAGEDCSAQQQSTGRHGPVIPPILNWPISGPGVEAHSALDAKPLLHTPGFSKDSLEMAPGCSGDRSPSIHGNLQHQLGLVSPPITSISFSRPSTSPGHSSVLDSPVSGERTSTSQPRSVKHLTCWYWATQGCKLPEHLCLYSHFNTGRLAEAPIQKQRGRESSFYNTSLHRESLSKPHFIKPNHHHANTKSGPAVAGRNATNPRPVYNDWRSHHRAHSAVVGPRIQKQLQRIHDKAAMCSAHTSIKDGKSESVNYVEVDRPGSAEMATDHSRAQSDDLMSSTFADPYSSMSIGLGVTKQPTTQPSTCSSCHFDGHFVPPSPTAQHDRGWTHHCVGDNHSIGDDYSIGGGHGGMSSNNHMGSNCSDPQQSSSNSPKTFNASAASGHHVDHSSGSIETLQKQIQVKDKVIADLAGTVEALEIMYGFSIDDQTQTFQNFLHIAHSMEEEARAAGNPASSIFTKGPYPRLCTSTQGANLILGQASNVPTLSTSTPPYGYPPTNHERIITAMEGFWNLVNMEKVALAKSNGRKELIGRELEGIGASRLLPRGWVER